MNSEALRRQTKLFRTFDTILIFDGRNSGFNGFYSLNDFFRFLLFAKIFISATIKVCFMLIHTHNCQEATTTSENVRDSSSVGPISVTLKTQEWKQKNAKHGRRLQG